MKARIQADTGYLEFRCPGCGRVHSVPFGPQRTEAVWGFDGNYESPTIIPSVKVTWSWLDDNGNSVERCCHSVITNGQIAFGGDSTHNLRGQTVELPAF